MKFIYMRDFRQKTSRARIGEGALPLRAEGSFSALFPKTYDDKAFFLQKNAPTKILCLKKRCTDKYVGFEDFFDVN